MRKLLALLCLFTTALCFPAVIAAQGESLLIGAGDLLHVQVYDTPEMDQHPRVSDAGDVSILFAGEVHVVGSTPAQAAAAIAKAMVAKQVMNHPQVAVSVEQYATQTVSIVGEAAHPGQYAIATPRPVLDVLSMGGGLTAMADRHILIERGGSAEQQVSYFVANHPELSAHNDIKVYPGDIIVIPRVKLVYVLGDVSRPGGYPVSFEDRPVTLLETLAQAGSPNRSAAQTAARLMHKNGTGYTEVTVDLAQIERGKKPDFALQPDDVLFVPFSYARNFVINGTSIAASVASAAVYVH